MANKRLFIYAAFLAICYLLGATWAETATQTLTSSSSNSNNNASQLNAPGKAAVTTAAPAIATPKVISSTATSANTSSSPSECSCVGALLPQVDANGKELPMCAECKCSHVARNTTLIKVVVIIVIWIISILVIYMLFLMCLDPLLNKRVKANNYQEHTNEDDEPTPPIPAGPNNQELSARANVLNRVGHQQDKWKRQVREQRRHIYDRHTMLN
ncbi:uncharacterized protein CG1161 isoform X1 [Drosophila virilis]|uniref:Uncharacterized protein n=1 Tax=Drosophila virilis TaxID=7244 RepID=B4M5E6_DROVI|nr:uncharacterized protein CG1161 isoform X1 [Drosophila virilis]EDW59857.1 uncharacterized protein Dvir_GJ11105 [Drosophila virilis]